ncbi:MAG TPA: TonB-dependent receptor, partial [Terriglobales bacterium]|nr:TonB-dependent receptor [Terriglobales bacterium]
MKKHFHLVYFLLFAFSSLCFGQGLGSIVGTVTDPTGSVVPGAQVRATETSTGLSRATVTDAQGYFVLSALRPSDYTIAIEARGFRTANLKALTLLADQTLTANARLELGSATEIIDVTGNATQVDTTTSTIKQVVETQRITDLPLNGRNAAELSLQVAGVVNSANGGADQGVTKTFPGGVTYSVNGSRQNQISYQLDGGNFVDEYTNINQPFPFPDALQEFSVQTSNYGAEYGQNAGGVVNVVTKSGTDQFHGDVFEFLRNAVFNARKWDSDFNAKDHGRDQLKRNQFGGTLGGPVIHGRTFFFVGYQGTRVRNVGNPTTASVFTPAQRASATDPAIIKLLTFIPAGDPTNPDAAGQPQVTYARPSRENFDEILGRIDHSLATNDRLTFRYDRNRYHKDAVFDPANILNYADATNAIV